MHELFDTVRSVVSVLTRINVPKLLVENFGAFLIDVKATASSSRCTFLSCAAFLIKIHCCENVHGMEKCLQDKEYYHYNSSHFLTAAYD